MMKRLLTIGVASLGCIFARTTAARVAPGYAACLAAAGATTSEMRACSFAELARRDRELNEVYGRLIAALEQPAQAQLREAERAWVAYRDAECRFRRSVGDGGTIALLISDTCSIELTTARVQELRKTLQAASS